MRFFANGPNIPDRLLDAQEEGNVVFLCGAGVSIPAGLPDFACLAAGVINRIRPLEDSPINKAFAPWKHSPCTKEEGNHVPEPARIPLDQIFNLLQAEYDPELVNNVVAELLVDPGVAQVWRTHETIARLSRGADGVPQIVTTNFDLLFENVEAIKVCIDRGEVFEPPTFPNLRHSKSVSGLTYLHGRLRTDESKRHDYILSSADFGRAYLAEGWATTFVMQLLENYTVVLLGYQADDPPMNYLLQGLRRTSRGALGNLYAFVEGTPENVDAKWRDRGVSPITYPNIGENHAPLWNSLEAWADRAHDQEAWRSGKIEIARKGPRALAPHERGQVVHVVRSTQGAKAFADAVPPMPSEWICVFDKERRLDPRVSNPRSSDSFDPRAHYALDYDPPQRPGIERPPSVDAVDLIGGAAADGKIDSQFRLAMAHGTICDQLPTRLRHLGSWLAGNCADPIVAWWAAKQHRLHPFLVAMIFEQIEQREHIPERARKVWSLIFEHFRNNQFHHPFVKWRAARMRVARDGWTPMTFREVERLTEPVIKIGFLARTDLRRVKPPLELWSKVALHDIANFAVEFPDQNERTELFPNFTPLVVPDEHACAVFSLASRNLIRGLERLQEVNPGRLERFADMIPYKLSTVPLYTDTARDERGSRSHAERHVLWVAELLGRAAEIDPDGMVATVALWPSGRNCVLNKLRMFAWNQAKAYSGDEIAFNLLNLDQNDFWHHHDEPELFHLIRNRWQEFSRRDQNQILAKIIAGPNSSHVEKPEDYRRMWTPPVVQAGIRTTCDMRSRYCRMSGL